MAFYPEFAQHPSKPHQCIWTNDDGVRCRSYAMRNQYTCYHHQTADMPEVISNDPFPLPRADNFENIQMAVAEILERLAENRMDPKRASALLNGLQIASSNLHRRNTAAAAATRLARACHPDRSEVPAPPATDPCPSERSEAGCPIHDSLTVMSGPSFAEANDPSTPASDSAPTSGCPIHDSLTVMSGPSFAETNDPSTPASDSAPTSGCPIHDSPTVMGGLSFAEANDPDTPTELRCTPPTAVS